MGWREWVSLPEFGIQRIKAKVDTGARTSALHAFNLRLFNDGGQLMVHFKIHPIQRKNDEVVECIAKVKDERIITDSGGHKEKRYVILTQLILGQQEWPIEITLSNRDTMLFRMLLGRTAMYNHVTVDPASSFLLGKPAKVGESNRSHKK